MSTPSKLVLTYGPIVEFVKGTTGFICRKRGEDHLTTVLVFDGDAITKRFDHDMICEARTWMREFEFAWNNPSAVAA